MAAINSSRAYFEVSGANDTALTGTVASSSTALTGTTTDFTNELIVGDVIREDGTTDFLIVTAIGSGTAATVHIAPTAAMSGATVDPLTWSQVSAAFSATGPAPEASEIDVTTWDTAGFREKIAGLIDSGTFECTIYFQPKVSSHAGLITDFYAGTRRAWRLWYKDSAAGTAPSSSHDVSNSRWTFVGDILGVTSSAEQDSAVQGTLSVAITGQAVITAGTDA